MLRESTITTIHPLLAPPLGALLGSYLRSLLLARVDSP